MSIHRVIERLETYVRESTWFPLGYRLVSLERVLELVEKMRSTLPEEVGRARVISNNKDRVIREAQERAQAIVTEANEAHHSLIDQHEVVRRARTTADIIMREAQEKAKKIRDGADAYAASVLHDLHGRLEVAAGSVKAGEEALARSRADAQANADEAEIAPAKTGSAKSVPSKNSRRSNVFDAQDSLLDEQVVEKPRARVPMRQR